jgi:hypothetical protein
MRYARRNDLIVADPVDQLESDEPVRRVTRSSVRPDQVYAPHRAVCELFCLRPRQLRARADYPQRQEKSKCQSAGDFGLLPIVRGESRALASVRSGPWTNASASVREDANVTRRKSTKWLNDFDWQ